MAIGLHTSYSPDQQHAMYLVICWKEGTSEFVDSFETKATASSYAKELNQWSETSKEVFDDFFTVELAEDYQ